MSLSPLPPHRICPCMRYVPALPALLAIALALPASGQTRKPPAPAHPEPAAAAARKLGDFDDWTAAIHQESGQTVCYAFSYARHSTPVIPGRDRVILTVTERPTGRDAVAISAGINYPQGAAMTVQVDTTGLDFYISQRNAFARDGKAAVAAFAKGSQALARSPGARDGQVIDTFSLKGFSAAYAAINKACPVR